MEYEGNDSLSPDFVNIHNSKTLMLSNNQPNNKVAVSKINSAKIPFRNHKNV